jgi:hypothetical protein
MEPPKTKRLVLTSVNQVIALVQSNPQLVQQMPRFSKLSTMAPSTSPKKSCNCGAKKNITTPDVNKQATENILSSLSPADFLQIKSILALNELCYYNRNSDNKLEMICV